MLNIHLLNKFGHGVTYSYIEEKDTALCLQKLAATANRQAILPLATKPYFFTTLEWDYIDKLEETLTGKGRPHRVIGIATQAGQCLWALVITGAFT